MTSYLISFELSAVLPLTREWIEINVRAIRFCFAVLVLPLTREWIEIKS